MIACKIGTEVGTYRGLGRVCKMNIYLKEIHFVVAQNILPCLIPIHSFIRMDSLLCEGRLPASLPSCASSSSFLFHPTSCWLLLLPRRSSRKYGAADFLGFFGLLLVGGRRGGHWGRREGKHALALGCEDVLAYHLLEGGHPSSPELGSDERATRQAAKLAQQAK